jgi:hypothetical protein
LTTGFGGGSRPQPERANASAVAARIQAGMRGSSFMDFSFEWLQRLRCATREKIPWIRRGCAKHDMIRRFLEKSFSMPDALAA